MSQPEDEVHITVASLALFLDYAPDASNCAGNHLVGENVGHGKEARGNLTQTQAGWPFGDIQERGRLVH